MPPKRKSKGGNASVTSKRAKTGTKRSEGKDMATAMGAKNDDLDAEWSFAGDVTTKGLHQLMLFTGKGIKGSSKIAGFDLDSTLIVPKSGRKFGTGKKIR